MKGVRVLLGNRIHQLISPAPAKGLSQSSQFCPPDIQH